MENTPKTLTQLEVELAWHQRRLKNLKRRIRNEVQWINGNNPDLDAAMMHQLCINDIQKQLVVARTITFR